MYINISLFKVFSPKTSALALLPPVLLEKEPKVKAPYLLFLEKKKQKKSPPSLKI